jgi:hypothetical protein
LVSVFFIDDATDALAFKVREQKFPQTIQAIEIQEPEEVHLRFVVSSAHPRMRTKVYDGCQKYLRLCLARKRGNHLEPDAGQIASRKSLDKQMNVRPVILKLLLLQILYRNYSACRFGNTCANHTERGFASMFCV